MRYFDCTLGTNSEQIFLRASFKIQGSFPAVIYQTNGYINQNIKNKIQFFFYREETMMRALLGYESKAEGLTPEEAKEQKILRKEYMELIRVNLRSQLNNIDMEQKDGSIVNLGEKYGEKYMNKKGN